MSDIQQSIAHRSSDGSYAVAIGDTDICGVQLTRFTGDTDSDVSKLIADSLFLGGFLGGFLQTAQTWANAGVVLKN